VRSDGDVQELLSENKLTASENKLTASENKLNFSKKHHF
jgi:hypothetical protein